jgi:hypothetical protein
MQEVHHPGKGCGGSPPGPEPRQPADGPTGDAISHPPDGPTGDATDDQISTEMVHNFGQLWKSRLSDRRGPALALGHPCLGRPTIALEPVPPASEAIQASSAGDPT